jgi:hypothetical protein
MGREGVDEVLMTMKTLFDIFQVHGYGYGLYDLIKLELEGKPGRSGDYGRWFPRRMFSVEDKGRFLIRSRDMGSGSLMLTNITINDFLVPIDQYHKLVVMAFEEDDLWRETASMVF